MDLNNVMHFGVPMASLVNGSLCFLDVQIMIQVDTLTVCTLIVNRKEFCFANGNCLCSPSSFGNQDKESTGARESIDSLSWTHTLHMWN